MQPPGSLERLAQLPLCRSLTEAEIAQLFHICQEVSARAGEVVFREGDAGDALYVLVEGSLDIQKQGRSGEQQQLTRLGAGNVFGEMSLLSGSARSASAVAVSDVRLLRIPGARFSQLLSESHPAALKVVWNLAQVMSRRLQMMDEKLVELLDQGRKKEELAEFQRILTNWSF